MSAKLLLTMGVFALAVMWAGCSSPADPANSPTGSEQLPLTLVEAPPLAPPLLEVNGHEVDPLSFEWVVSGSLATKYPSESAGLEVLPSIALQGESVEVTWHSDATPSGVSVKVFAVGVDNQPGATVAEYDCLDTIGTCQLILDGADVSMRLDVPSDAAAVVVMLEYSLEFADLEATDAAITMDRASYGWRILQAESVEGDGR